VAQRDVAAVLETDRLVAEAVHHFGRVVLAERRLLARVRLAAAQSRGPVARLDGAARSRAATRQTSAVDEAGAFDGDVLQPLAPDEAVVPVAVAEVLKGVPLVRLRQVVAALRLFRVGCEYGRA